MDTESTARLRRYLAMCAPGTELRSGLERIVHGRTGGLIVLGNNKSVEKVSTGGFDIDVEFSATALRELAKLDGAIVLSADRERIIRAGVQLMPDRTLPTRETGTRHRSADRTAQQTGVACVTVSQSMSTITLFLDGGTYPIQRSEPLLGRANQALATLERYKVRLWEASRHLSALEIQDQVAVRDLAMLLTRWEMVLRLEREIAQYIVELGTDGRLVELQLTEAIIGVAELADFLAKDYAHMAEDGVMDVARLGDLSDAELLDPLTVVRAVGLPTSMTTDDHLTSLGYRQLAEIQRLPTAIAARIVEHFGSLQSLFGATTAELLEIDGVGEGRARMVRDGLVRMAEAAYSGSLYDGV